MVCNHRVQHGLSYHPLLVHSHPRGHVSVQRSVMDRRVVGVLMTNHMLYGHVLLVSQHPYLPMGHPWCTHSNPRPSHSGNLVWILTSSPHSILPPSTSHVAGIASSSSTHGCHVGLRISMDNHSH